MFTKFFQPKYESEIDNKAYGQNNNAYKIPPTWFINKFGIPFEQLRDMK